MKILRFLYFPLFLIIGFTTVSAENIETSKTPIEKYAEVLIRYSLNIQPGETVVIRTSFEGSDLALAAYREALLAGGHPELFGTFKDSDEIFYQYANKNQLSYISETEKFMAEHFDALLVIGAPSNTKSLSNVNPKSVRISSEAKGVIYMIVRERAAKNELKWCYTTFPTNALAQESEMGLLEYQKFVFDACYLNFSDPSEQWKKQSEFQNELVKRLEGKKSVVLKGTNIDMQLSIDGRRFLVADGKFNFPDGEIFTSPVENSANGWVRFSYPVIYNGREVENVELWFEDGKVIKEVASKNQAFLTEILNTDNGSRIMGEFGIGTNKNIQKFTKNMLYDEKIAGTIHIAVGSGFPEIGSQNKSAIHWDMLCDMSDATITVDGEIFYKDGDFVK